MSDLFGTAGGLWTNKQNQEFAEEMASTQYQRAMADMKAAGLNPAAVFGSGGGSPAAAPGGQMTNPVSGGEGVMASAKSFVDMQAQLASAEKAKAETTQTKEATEVTKATAHEARANAKIAQNEAAINDKETSAQKVVMDSTGGKILHGINKYALGPLSQAIGAARAFGSGKGTAFGGYASAQQARLDAQEQAERQREHQRELITLRRDATQKGTPTFHYPSRSSPSSN